MSVQPYIGRRESVGFGKETTPGTSVAPAIWQKQLKFSLDQKTTVAKDQSGLGIVENMHDSAVTEEWAEGSLNGHISDLAIGYLLENMFGSCTAVLHSGETTVYDNTFSVLETAPPPTLTFTRSNPNYEGRYALGTQSDLEIDGTLGQYVDFTSTIMSKIRATGTDTVSYAAQNKFTSKHVIVKYASTVSGLSGATALHIKSFKLKFSRKADRFVPMGAIDPISFDPESFGITGQFVLRFEDDTIEPIALANTLEAMSISIVNTDVTIGSAAHPSLIFTMPQVRFTPIKLDDNLDKTISQTIAFTAEYNTGLGYMCQPVLTASQNGY